jgi:hypothetical protein
VQEQNEPLEVQPLTVRQPKGVRAEIVVGRPDGIENLMQRSVIGTGNAAGTVKVVESEIVHLTGEQMPQSLSQSISLETVNHARSNVQTEAPLGGDASMLQTVSDL